MVDWQTIVRTHGPMAFDTAWRLLGHVADTEDVVQEALIDAFCLHQRQTVANWGALLRHLATRRAIDRLRRRRTIRLPEGTPIREPASPPEQAPDALAVERELAERLRFAVAELPDREAQVFSLRYFGELDNNEIAERLETTPQAVATALHKARQKLKQQLGLSKSVLRREHS